MAAHRIYIHLTWSTLGRRPMIDVPTRAFLDQFFRRIAIQERVAILSLGFLRTHVHLLVRTAPRYDLPRLVQLLKGGSSYAASRQPRNVLGLRWNREYSATSVSPKLLRHAVAYIEGQSRRHPGEAILGGPITPFPRRRRGPDTALRLSAVSHRAHSSEWEPRWGEGEVQNAVSHQAHSSEWEQRWGER